MSKSRTSIILILYGLLSVVMLESVGFSNWGFAPVSGGARFHGQPFAFGTGSRSARVSALVNEAAPASGIDDLARYVDDVVYDAAGSYFTVVNGRRILSVGDSAFARTRTGQLLQAGHELVHAQQFERFMRRGGYKSLDDAADDFFSEKDNWQDNWCHPSNIDRRRFLTLEFTREGENGTNHPI